MATRQDTDVLVIQDLRGGMNNQDPKNSLPEDQTVLAENVEYFTSTLGERRRGMQVVDTTDSEFDDYDTVVHLGSYLPTLAPLVDTHLVGEAATEGGAAVFAERTEGVWAVMTAVDAPITTSPAVYQTRSLGAHSKWWVAYKSGVARTHVWDGETIRRVGLAAPTAAPTVADTVAGGAYTGNRFFRVRTLRKVAGVSTVLSVPSSEVEFVPSGVNDGAVITQPTLPGESETDWIVEASDGDGLWYQIATLPVATTTYTDMTQPATDYAVDGTLSPDIGDYAYPPSVKIIKADEDRLLYIADREDPQEGSTVWWTPVSAAPGIGNDERVPLDITSFKRLDWQEGGPITDASDPVLGAFYVFKAHAIYKGQRTGNANSAYDFYKLDPSHGAIPGSVISGVDEYGRGAIYFIDTAIGPMRVSSAGVQQLQGLGDTWRRVDSNAAKIVCHGIYYPDKKQVHWWVAVDGSATPTLKIVVQTNQVQSDNNGGTTRGWSLATGTIAKAYCSTVIPELVRDGETSATQLSFRPYIGFTADDVGGAENTVQVGDIGNTDNGDAYFFRVVTKPYILAGLLNRWGGLAAALLAMPNDDPDVVMTIRLIRDFGLETQEIVTDFVPEGAETDVIKYYDNLKLRDARSIQVEFIEVEP